MNKHALVLALTTLGCTRVWGFEEPVLADAGPPPVVREPCFENDKVEVKACDDGDSSRVCTPDGWSSWTACAKPGFRDLPPAPIPGRISHSAVWTGDELIIWGGRGPYDAYNDGAAYDPVKNTWRVIAPAPLSPRIDHAAVWMGKQMLVWGGRIDGSLASTYFADGATYDPRTNTWERVAGSPMSARARVASVWSTTTREALIWGGIYEFDFYTDDGAAFDPETRKWTYLSSTTAKPRTARSSFWDGNRLVVVGGECKGTKVEPCNDVWAYDPSTDLWERLSGLPTSFLANGNFAFTVAGKTSMVLFGGEKFSTSYGNGVLFDAIAKVGTPIAAPTTELGPIAPRTFATTFWADNKLFVHGGFVDGGFDGHSATWDPGTATWTPIETGLGPRMAASATTTPDDTFIFGGRREGTPPDYFVHLGDGRIFRHTR